LPLISEEKKAGLAAGRAVLTAGGSIEASFNAAREASIIDGLTEEHAAIVDGT